MKKSLAPLIAVLAFTGLLSIGCNNGHLDVNPDDLEALTVTVPIKNNWVFDKRPDLVMHIENPNNVAVTANASVDISTDFKEPVTSFETSVTLPAGGNADISIDIDQDLEPGFYKARCYVNGTAARHFVFGISPFDIVSAPDMQADFDTFWETALSQLPELNESTVTLTETKKSTDKYKLYMVEMPSVPNGIDGEPEIVRGYYIEPTDGKKHPVIMHFEGYDTLNKPPKMYCPSGTGEYSEFYLSHRGQYINHRTADKRDDGIDKDFENIYGDWFAYNFGDKDSYYYRGAFMDCVQAVRFMATRSTSDMNNLFAMGSSQGGALSYAAAALSDIPFTAIAPNVAFLGDYPDYFKIVGWPANVAKNNQGTMTDQEMYAFLSYFDTKNLATRISCAVYATIGLQDGTCPPHTNIAPYNNLNSKDKEMHFYPEMQHAYPSGWSNDVMKFFKARTK